MTEELMLAILAMDSYNQGPDTSEPGLKDVGTTIGTAIAGSALFDATADFFAQSYTWNGKTIISYRGTDDLVGDALTGYGLAFGVFNTPQSRLAAQFFNSVAANVGSSNVQLTGHSLGGGLAGFIAGLYGSDAFLFNNMPFELGLGNFALAQIDPFDLLIDDIFTSGPVQPGPTIPPAGTSGYFTIGEILQPARALSLQFTAVTGLASHAAGSPFDLHSMSLLVHLMYAQETHHTDWHSVGDPLFVAMFNNEIGKATGFGVEGVGGSDTASEKLRDAVAYSAIDEGTMPFGNQAIQALFDDADDLGRLYASPVGNSLLKNSSVKNALSEILVQYAGDLAKDHSEDPLDATGAITFNNALQTMTVDLDPAKWTSTFGTSGHDIIGVADFISSLMAVNVIPSLSLSALPIRSDPIATSHITKIVAATGGVLSTLGPWTAPDAYDGASGGLVLVGADNADILRGGSGDDYLFGGLGGDTIYGGLGTDTVFLPFAFDPLRNLIDPISGTEVRINSPLLNLYGIDTLFDCEFIEFADGTLAPIGGTVGSTQSNSSAGTTPGSFTTDGGINPTGDGLHCTSSWAPSKRSQL
ncbi:MAG: Mbeg1-like protein [Minisyncoccia bacterium]